MKVQSTFYIDFISKTVDVLLISSFITKQMPKLLIFDAFTLLICKKNVAIYALLRCKIFSLKIWLCKIFDKFHVWVFCIYQDLSPHRHYQELTQIKQMYKCISVIVNFRLNKGLKKSGMDGHHWSMVF